MSFNINSAIQSRTAILIGSSNYSTWACQVHNLLTMATWWDIVSGASTYVAQADAAAQTTWNSNDRQAQLLISVFIHEDMQHLHRKMHMSQQGALHTLLLQKISGINWQLSMHILALPASMKPSHRLLAFRSLIRVTTQTAADLMICQLQWHLRSML